MAYESLVISLIDKGHVVTNTVMNRVILHDTWSVNVLIDRKNKYDTGANQRIWSFHGYVRERDRRAEAESAEDQL